MVIPVGERYRQDIYLMEKKDGKLVRKQLIPTLFVPMTGRSEKERTDQARSAQSAAFQWRLRGAGRIRASPRVGTTSAQMTLVSEPPPKESILCGLRMKTGAAWLRRCRGCPSTAAKLGSLSFRFTAAHKAIVEGSECQRASRDLAIFYDDERRLIGDGTGRHASLEPPIGTRSRGTAKIPTAARHAIVQLGLNGATGRLDVDDVRVTSGRDRRIGMQSTVRPARRQREAGAVFAADSSATDDCRVPLHFGNPREEYSAAVSDGSPLRLERPRADRIDGADRVTFLHGFCTNDIKRLATGTGCEAFVTNVKGRILGDIWIEAGPTDSAARRGPRLAGSAVAHLERYIINEDVVAADVSAEWGELLVMGPTASSALSHTFGDVGTLRHSLRSTSKSESRTGEIRVSRRDVGRRAAFVVCAPHAVLGEVWDEDQQRGCTAGRGRRSGPHCESRRDCRSMASI